MFFFSFLFDRPSSRPYRSTRDQERRRSPRPPPTIHQSTQRTIVYMHESSSSKQHSKSVENDLFERVFL
jgi:hypothetical protein